MKNWEFYENELKKYSLAFAMKGNQIYGCEKVACHECDFYIGELRICDAAKVKWLYQEHKEPIVLTEDEKSLCKLLGRGWIARNEDNRLRWFDANIAIPNTVSNVIDLTLGFPQCRFDFIKWEDEEPWEVKVND